MQHSLDTILLVDDDRVTNLMHRRQIARRGLAQQVDVVTDGRSALDYLLKCADDGRSQPELILLDINMPRMNGFEFLDEYATLPDDLHENQCVIMVSTSTRVQDKARAEADPMVSSYEVKPLTEEDLVRIVRGCQSRAAPVG